MEKERSGSLPPVHGHTAATSRSVISSAGECGVKDQVSRTRPNSDNSDDSDSSHNNTHNITAQ